MDARLEKYIRNVQLSRELSKPSYPEGLRESEITALIRENAERQAVLKRENDAILRDPDIGILGRSAAELTDEQAAALYDFAAALSRHLEQTDNALSYRIHSLLLARCRLTGDLDGQIRELYWTGLTLYYLNYSCHRYHTQLFNQTITDSFQQGASYLPRIAEFGAETQGYILRCYGNRKLGREAINSLGSDYYPNLGDLDNKERQREIARFNDPFLRSLVPSFNWDAGLMALHFSMTSLLGTVRTIHDPTLPPLILQSAEYIYAHAEAAQRLHGRQLQPRVRYVYVAARFHAGLIPMQELLDFFYGRAVGADTTKFDLNSMFDCLYCPMYFADYYLNQDAERSPANDRRLARMRAQVMDYIFHMPINECITSVSTILADTVPLLCANRDDSESQMLSLMLSLHRPTYVHSLMVAHISCMLLDELIDKQPELFARFDPTLTPVALLRERENLHWRMYKFGVYHDMGKVAVLEHVSQYSRSLTDEEFFAIQQHSYVGYMILRQFSQAQDYAIAAMGHHKAYDGVGGYPKVYKRVSGTTQLLIDILTVADSIDAATDNVGRSYAASIPLTTLRDQLRRGSGTRYAPYVTVLMDDPDFFDAVEDALLTERPAFYSFVYHKAQEA